MHGGSDEVIGGKRREKEGCSDHIRRPETVTLQRTRGRMSPPSYQPVPSDSDSPPPTPTPRKIRAHLVTIRRVLLFSITLLVVSFAAYKSGQWSAERQLLQPGHAEDDITKKPPIPSSTNDTAPSTHTAPSNNTDMSGGKYSVG